MRKNTIFCRISIWFRMPLGGGSVFLYVVLWTAPRVSMLRCLVWTTLMEVELPLMSTFQVTHPSLWEAEQGGFFFGEG